MRNTDKQADNRSRFSYSLFVHRLSSGMAVFGGVLLLLLICLTTFSVLGRTLFSAPLNGDFEIIKMGCAIALFYFLPWAQLSRGHLAVRLEIIARAWRLWLSAIGDLLFFLFALLLLLYLPRGGLELLAHREETIVLSIPIWWAHIVITPALLTLLLVSSYCAYCSCRSACLDFKRAK